MEQVRGAIPAAAGHEGTLDRYGHLMPGQAEAVAARLDVIARGAIPTPSAPVVAIV